METARAALEWYEKSVAARRMETLGVLGSTAPPTPAAVQLLKLESQQRVRYAPAAAPAPVAAMKDLAGELEAFESLIAPIAATAAATEVHTGFQDEDSEEDSGDNDDSDSGGEDAVAMVKARKRAAPAPGEATKAAAKSKGASARSLAMAEKLDALSAEHSKLKSELSGKPGS